MQNSVRKPVKIHEKNANNTLKSGRELDRGPNARCGRLCRSAALLAKSHLEKGGRGGEAPGAAGHPGSGPARSQEVPRRACRSVRQVGRGRFVACRR